MTRYLAAIALVALAGCGQRGDLKPASNTPLPVAPVGARATPTPAALLTPSIQARPARSDEVLKSSEQRPRDDFTLPPN
ncbi:hypothetical protein SAMN06297144_0902 [Sphingomonas guangdongensis]|uniref:Lipoprotein-attachment site-containing protein n=1 Tax=Sphingomonas guangdongensis TaxID=1141890 RepID=A0A285QE52_9SPHN|nr:lipoprotein [Sphingomonas guangdongensis]SOB80126.1 hypothetical protein SAMN06297144_0902 [Sphingomonas guangdongensis]